MRSTTFLFIACCTSVQIFGENRAQTGAQQHGFEPAGALRRDVAPRRPSPRSFSRPTRAPRHIESRVPRASPSPCRTCAVRAADRRSVRGPGRTRVGRGAPWYDGIFAVTATSRASRPYLRPSAFPPRARHHRSCSPPHQPWPVAGELAPPSFPSAFQPPEPPLCNL
jgi:hypothetical protein